MISWISESEDLPAIGQRVLLATPRQSGEFWDIETAQLLARHEDVRPVPIRPGDRWPTDYYWGRHGRDTSLITGNGWWARLDKIPLPPGAAHQIIRGYHCVVQLGEIFVPQRRA
jgi:hypothetical protein